MSIACRLVPDRFGGKPSHSKREPEGSSANGAVSVLHLPMPETGQRQQPEPALERLSVQCMLFQSNIATAKNAIRAGWWVSFASHAPTD